MTRRKPPIPYGKYGDFLYVMAFLYLDYVITVSEKMPRTRSDL